MANKAVFPKTNTFVWNQDATFSDEEHRYVTYQAAGTETKAKLAAILAAGVSINDAHPNATLQAAGVRAVSISVMLLQDLKALVIINWGIPVDPILDGEWVYEVQTVERQLTTGLSIDTDTGLQNVPIKVKYVPTTVPPADRAQYLIDNARTNNRGATVGQRKDLIQVIGRRQISHTAASAWVGGAFVGKSLFEWPRRYVNYVNEEKANPVPGRPPILTAGTWFCNNMRIYSKNHNWSYIVETSFVYDVDGFEEFVLFIDRYGLRPHDVEISDAMKLPWPVKANPADPDPRESDQEPYGASRPQVIKGLRNFQENPLLFNLGGF
jgi:hypothetical protein